MKVLLIYHKDMVKAGSSDFRMMCNLLREAGAEIEALEDPSAAVPDLSEQYDHLVLVGQIDYDLSGVVESFKRSGKGVTMSAESVPATYGKKIGVLEFLSFGAHKIIADVDPCAPVSRLPGKISGATVVESEMSISLSPGEIEEMLKSPDSLRRILEQGRCVLEFKIGEGLSLRPELVGFVTTPFGPRPLMKTELELDSRKSDLLFAAQDEGTRAVLGADFLSFQNYLVDPSWMFMRSDPPEESGHCRMQEAAGRKGADRALANFKLLLAILDPMAKVSGLEAESSGVRITSNHDQEGNITTLVFIGPRGQKRLSLQSGLVNQAEYESKLASCKENP